MTFQKKNDDFKDPRLSDRSIDGNRGNTRFLGTSLLLLFYYYWIFTIDLEINPLLDRSHKYAKDNIDQSTGGYIILGTLLLIDFHVWKINKRIIKSNLFEIIIILGNILVIALFLFLVIALS